MIYHSTLESMKAPHKVRKMKTKSRGRGRKVRNLRRFRSQSICLSSRGQA